MERGPDYIVVGGGSAGCVLANRLSRDPSVRVLVLEAGAWARRKETHIPAAWPKLLGSRLDWNLLTDPVPSLNSRRLRWPRGKALGGSSAINAMIHVRGFQADFDGWRDKAGAEGWDWQSVLPYFERSLLPAEVLRPVNPLSRVFCAAAVEAGLGFTPDFNGDVRTGAGFFRVAQRGGERASAASLYLAPIRGERPNLEIVTGALTHRVIMEGQRAIGVEFSRGRNRQRVLANREVILAAGAVHSPRILMSSGIGPADRLSSLGVRVQFDLPGVGENLQDHLVAVTTWQCRKPVTLESADTVANLLRWATSHRGPLTSNLAEAGAFVLPDGTGTPTMQLLFAPAFYMSHATIRPGGPGFSIGGTVLRPRSRGQILLRSVNPEDTPIIQPDYLIENSDMEATIDAVLLCRTLANTAPFDAYRGDEVWPGAAVETRAQCAEFIRRTAETLYHPAGTCAMGTGRMAVVNASLRVYGIEGLRVADASVMPSLVSANPNATVVMIAEKAADLILGRGPIENSYRSDKKFRMRNAMVLA